MRARKREAGFTLIELAVVTAILSTIVIIFWVLIIGVGVRGNFYWTASGIEVQLKEENPQVSRIILSQSQRNIFNYSKIVVMEKTGDGKNADEKLTVYCLDSNILFDYKLFTCPH